MELSELGLGFKAKLRGLIAFNDVPYALELAELAFKHSDEASCVVSAIKQHIKQCPAQHRLPALFLVGCMLGHGNCPPVYKEQLSAAILEMLVFVSDNSDASSRAQLRFIYASLAEKLDRSAVAALEERMGAAAVRASGGDSTVLRSIPSAAVLEVEAAAAASQPEHAKMLKEGRVHEAVAALGIIGPQLPPPGDSAAELLINIVETVDGSDNSSIMQLATQAAEIVDIVDLSKCQFVVSDLRGDMNMFVKELKGVKAFADTVKYQRGLQTQEDNSADKEEYEELLTKLTTLKAKDPTAEAKLPIDELGGMTAVVNDKVKLEQVSSKLGVHEQLLMANSDNLGTCWRIKQTDLRAFWRKMYCQETQVQWSVFWKDFPCRLLKSLMMSSEDIAQLTTLLKEEASRSSFYTAVERVYPKQYVCVYELEDAFDSGELLPQVEQMLKNYPTGTPSHDGGSVTPRPGRVCQLPPMSPHYIDRGDEAATIMERLLTPGSLVLVGPEGVGKSCLAADVGWRLMRDGQAARGALWVGLENASSAVEVEARFCASLGIPLAKTGAHDRIIAAIKDLAAVAKCGASDIDGAPSHQEPQPPAVPPMAALLVLDRADDATLQPEAEALLMGLLKAELPVPSVQQHQHQQHGAGSSPDLGPILQLALGRLLTDYELQAAAQLSVFPSAFNKDDAVSVLGVTKHKARRLLRVFLDHELLQLQSPQQHVMQSSIRRQVAQLGDPTLLAEAEGRYAGMIGKLLLELAEMHRRPNEEQASLAAAARRRQDLQKFFQLFQSMRELLEELGRGGASNPVKVAKLLADPALNPNIQNEDGVTPLCMACQKGTYRTVNMLIEAGADVNAESQDGRTPLFFALIGSMSEIANSLVNAGADIHKRDKVGITLCVKLWITVTRLQPTVDRPVIDG
ncbi:hypothetical protein GPECTOR_93g618 [Gonium pectorale]|uniref:Uncharacterized protein n=1 Tax=Gonium pectorale TaxID=33097 RepID=A0A150G0I9_GONPE|nr:hypothetical protein GPECTOR_93g618 [Gonium pectorale]|eukprot:KXZ43348.1 hypothetical protein GPECTOR_93g618 [Gonium pectorale]